MAKINLFKLEIDEPDRNQMCKVTASYKLRFQPADYGKKFAFSIRLRPANFQVGEAPNPAIPSVLYRFKFGNSTIKRVTGSPFTAAEPIRLTRQVPANLLDVDPGNKPAPNGPGTAEQDEIFASMLLTTAPPVTLGGQPGVVAFIDEKHSNVETITVDTSLL